MGLSSSAATNPGSKGMQLGSSIYKCISPPSLSPSLFPFFITLPPLQYLYTIYTPNTSAVFQFAFFFKSLFQCFSLSLSVSLSSLSLNMLYLLCLFQFLSPHCLLICCIFSVSRHLSTVSVYSLFISLYCLFLFTVPLSGLSFSLSSLYISIHFLFLFAVSF